MSVVENKASEVCNKLEKIRRLCEDEDEAVPTSVVEVVELPLGIAETRCNNENLVDQGNNLERELEDVRSVERLTCTNLEVESACRKPLEARAKSDDAKFAKIVDEKAQAAKALCTRNSSLES